MGASKPVMPVEVQKNENQHLSPEVTPVVPLNDLMSKSKSEIVKPARRKFNLNLRLTVDPNRVYDNMGASFGGKGDESNKA